MKKSVRDVDVAGKRVLVRCDFNVPIKDGVITDDSRIVKSLPTIRYLLEQGARVVLCSHRGRPKGEVNPKYSLAPVAARLSELLGQPVPMVSDCVGEVAHKAVEALKPRTGLPAGKRAFSSRGGEKRPGLCKGAGLFG